MSRENVEIVRGFFDALAARGMEAALTFITADAVVHPFPEWPDDSEYRGHDGLRRLFDAWTENFDDFGLVAHEFREIGDRVVVLGETSGRIKGSGVPIRQPLGIVFSEFRDGQVAESRNFLTWQEALEAVAVRE